MDDKFENRVPLDQSVHFTLADRTVFRRPQDHQFAFKWSLKPEDVEKNKLIKEMTQNLKYMDIFNFLLSISGFCIMLVDNEMLFRANQDLKETVSFIPLTDTNNILRFVNIGLTVPLIILLVCRQELAFRIAKESKYVRLNDQFKRSKMLVFALVEVAIHLIFSIPYREPNLCYYSAGRTVCNFYSDIVMLVAVLRFYLIFKVYYHFSQWKNTHSSEICDINMVESGVIFVFKCQLKKNPYRQLFTMFIGTILLMSYITRVFERAYYNTNPIITAMSDSTLGFQDYTNFLNVLWLTTVTMATVGFGDYFCKSHLGRFMSTIVAFQGILLVSLLLVSLDRTTKLNQFQAISYEFINKLQARELIRHHSAIVVADVLRVCAYKKRKRVLIERGKKLQGSVTREVQAQMDRQLEELEFKIKDTMNKITREKILLMKLRQSLVQEFEWPLEDLLRQLKSEMEKDIKEISGQIAHMRDTKNLLSNIQSYQSVLQKQIEYAINNGQQVQQKIKDETRNIED